MIVQQLKEGNIMENLLDQVKWEICNQMIQNGELTEYKDLYLILD